MTLLQMISPAYLIAYVSRERSSSGFVLALLGIAAVVAMVIIAARAIRDPKTRWWGVVIFAVIGALLVGSAAVGLLRARLQ